MGIIGLVILAIAAWFVVSIVVALNDRRRANQKERLDAMRLEAMIQARKAQVLADEADTRRQQEQWTPPPFWNPKPKS